MKKDIKIKEKKYTLNSNAFNIIEYKNYFGRNMSNDVYKLVEASRKLLGNVTGILRNIDKKENIKKDLNTWEIFIEKLIPITWILIDENERPGYEEFSKSIDNVGIGDEWLISVIEILTLSILFPRINGL